MKKYECNKCKDEPYEVEYVDVGVGNVPAAIIWNCDECYEVEENGRDRRAVRREGFVRDWKPSAIAGRLRRLYFKIKYRNRVPVEEAEIPF